jgi:hypothetical protein
MNNPQPSFEERARDQLDSLVREHMLATDKFRSDQIVEAILQAIKCGDFLLHIEQRSGASAVSYLPYRAVLAAEARGKAAGEAAGYAEAVEALRMDGYYDVNGAADWLEKRKGESK